MRALYAEKQKMEDSVEQAKIDCKEHADKVLEYVEAYKILGIEFGRSLTTDQFKAIYKPLMLKAHPDKNLTNEEQATEDFQIINNAVQFFAKNDFRFINDGTIAKDCKNESKAAVKYLETKEAALVDIGVQLEDLH